jgi:hypothetical protein
MDFYGEIRPKNPISWDVQNVAQSPKSRLSASSSTSPQDASMIICESESIVNKCAIIGEIFRKEMYFGQSCESRRFRETANVLNPQHCGGDSGIDAANSGQ